MSEELIKRLHRAANGASFDGRAGDAFLMREAADSLEALSRPAPVQVPEGYRLQPHSEFDAMNAFIRGETKAPPGYALVPVEPTDAMLDEIRWTDEITYKAMTARYRAMLAAAPSAPVAQEEGKAVDGDWTNMALVNWPDAVRITRALVKGGYVMRHEHEEVAQCIAKVNKGEQS